MTAKRLGLWPRIMVFSLIAALLAALCAVLSAVTGDYPVAAFMVLLTAVCGAAALLAWRRLGP